MKQKIVKAGVALCAAAVCVAAGAETFGEPYGPAPFGGEAKMYRLTNKVGMELTFTDFGARVIRIWAPDAQGKFADVSVGCDLTGPASCNGSAGATVGRYANRIDGGRFTLDGTTYQIECNKEKAGIKCALHTGPRGLNMLVWKARAVRAADAQGIAFSYDSPDGDAKMPGRLQVTVTHWLTEDNVWRIDYKATTDKATPINFTNHVYFNLKGKGQGTILTHDLQMFAEAMTPTNEGQIPTGEIRAVKGTPFDFTSVRALGAEVHSTDPQIAMCNGYDHNFVLRKDGPAFARAAVLSEKTSGRVVEVWTSEPGLQLYTGNGMGYTGVALETQHFPDSPNHPNFPNTILRPGETYESRTEYRFSVRN